MTVVTDFKKELITGVFWEPGDKDIKHLAAVKRSLTRTCRAVIYAKLDTGMGKKNQNQLSRFSGYFESRNSGEESLALYVRELFGDGVYFSREGDDRYWLLIIFEGAIVPGTDVSLPASLFEYLLNERASGLYALLPVYEFNENHMQECLKHYHASQHQKKIRRRIKLTVTGLLIAAVVIIPVFFFVTG